MQRKLFWFVLFATALAAQESKPQISNIAAISGEGPLFPPTCTASRSGYLENQDKKMTEAEIAKFITSSLRQGYVLTIYPDSKSGIFVNMECVPSANVKATPLHP
jgi:hypothetical protein